MPNIKQTTNSNSRDKKINVARWIVYPFLGVSVIFVSLTIVIFRYWDTLEHCGLFGDTFGSINAFFSALAFAGVIVAILLQRKELELQREELEQTREEFRKQTEEFETQNKTLLIQRFDNTFFNMLNLLASIINDVHFKGDGGRYFSLEIKRTGPPDIDKHGRDVFTYFREQLNPPLSKITSVEEFSKKVHEFFFATPYNANNHVGHYFRVIYSILKLIDQNRNLKFEEKKSYSNILRAQLSNDELFLLFCNCVYRDDFILFKLFIEKYSLLEHHYEFELDDEIMKQYQRRAFDKAGKFDLHRYQGQLMDCGIENFIIQEE